MGTRFSAGQGADDLCRTMIFFENSYSMDTRDHNRESVSIDVDRLEKMFCSSISAVRHSIGEWLRRFSAKTRCTNSVFKNLKVAEPVDRRLSSDHRNALRCSNLPKRSTAQAMPSAETSAEIRASMGHAVTPTLHLLAANQDFSSIASAKANRLGHGPRS